MEETIKLSVALPVYKSEKICWLAMESLCRQQRVDFTWELLVCEEQGEGSLGEKYFQSFADRLEEVGCRRILYLSLDEWYPLSAKWYFLSKEASETSIGFLLQAADCYSQPLRLIETYNLFLYEKADWVQSRKGFFYDIPTDNWAVFDRDANLFYHPCGLNMAISAKLLPRLYMEMRVKSSVDSWLYQVTKPEKVLFNESNSWIDGFDSNGYNNISWSRASKLINLEPPFISAKGYKGETIPKEIMERLLKLNEDNKGKSVFITNGKNPITIGIVKTRADYFNRAIYSIRKQVCENKIEIIVVDNMEKLQSIGSCYNEIVRRSTTEYVAFLGDDDYLMPDYVSALMAIKQRSELNGDKKIAFATYLTLIDGERYLACNALSPGLWEKKFLLETPFDETLKKYVTMKHYKAANAKGVEPAIATWYYGYMYYQHNGNISGNKFDTKEESVCDI